MENSYIYGDLGTEKLMGGKSNGSKKTKKTRDKKKMKIQHTKTV